MKPMRRASSAVEAVEASWTGRVWGTGAGYAPRPSTWTTSSDSARSTTALAKDGQLWSGSGPTRKRTSRSSASQVASSSIDGHVRPEFTPSTMCMIGRRARWSSRRSVSNVAIAALWGTEARIVSAARAAAPPASIQPSRASTSTGSLMPGSSWNS